MHVGTKEVVDGQFIVTYISVGMDCLHKGSFALTVITPLQERAESERKKATPNAEHDRDGKRYLAFFSNLEMRHSFPKKSNNEGVAF